MSETSLGNLTAKIGLNTASLQSGANQVKSHFSKMEGDINKSADGLSVQFSRAGAFAAAGIAVVGTAAAAFAIKAVDSFKDVGTEVMMLRTRAGGTAEEMSKLRFAAQMSGVDAEKLSKSMEVLARNVVANKTAFESYGIATENSSGKALPLREILLNTAAVFERMPNGIIKTQLAQQAFGKSGDEMIFMLSKGRSGLEALEKQASKYGLVLSKDNLDVVGKSIVAQREHTASMQGLQVQIGANVLPTLNKLTVAITEGLVTAMPAVAAIIDGAVIPALSGLTSALSNSLSFVQAHPGPVKVLAGVIATALVPALVTWAAAQAAAVATSIGGFLAAGASGALKLANALNLVTVSARTGMIGLTAMNVATGGMLLGLGLVAAKLISMRRELAEANQRIIDDAPDPAAALAGLESKLAGLKARMKDLPFFAFSRPGLQDDINDTEGDIKKLRVEMARLAAQDVTAAGTAEELANQMTSTGAVVHGLGGQMGMTATRVLELANTMKIDLSKATADQKAALIGQVQRLRETSSYTLRLGDALGVLVDWTKDATQKEQAFGTVLDVSVGSKVAASRAAMGYQDALSKLSEINKTTAADARALADANQRVADATQGLSDKQRVLAELEAKAVVDVRAVRDARRALEDQYRAIGDATENLAAKQRVLSDLERKEVVDLAAVAAAKRSAQGATESLSDAIRQQSEAARELREILNPSERTKDDAALSQEEAENRLERARMAEAAAEKALRDLRASGTASTASLTAARLDLEDAQHNTARATTGLADAEAKVQALTPAGIASSEALATAREALSDADQGVADARLGVLDADEKVRVAEAGDTERAANIAAARRDVEAATRGLRRAQEDLAPAMERLAVAEAGDTGRAFDLAAARRDVEAATRELGRSQVDLEPLMAKHGVSLDITTEKGRFLRGAIDEVTSAALAEAKAVLDAGGSMSDARAVMDSHIGDLRRVLGQLGLNTQQVDGLLRSLGLFDATTALATVGIHDRASGPLAGILAQMAAIAAANPTVHFNGVYVGAMAEGGIVKAKPGGSLRLLAEAGQDEAVVPKGNPARARQILTEAGMADLFGKGYSAGAGAGAAATPAAGPHLTIENMTFQVPAGQDPRQYADAVGPLIDQGFRDLLNELNRG